MKQLNLHLKSAALLSSMLVTAFVFGQGAAKDASMPRPFDGTSNKSPVKWNVHWPDETLPDFGYLQLAGVETFPIYHATEWTGAYSHHAQIGHLGDTFFASWSNQEWGEDGPGQRVLCSYSTNGESWTVPTVCMPSMSGMRMPQSFGRVLTAEAWVNVDGTMYLVADVNDKPGEEHPMDSGYETTASGQKRMLFNNEPGTKNRFLSSRVGWGRVARSVASNGDMGPIFWLVDDPPAPLEGFPQYADARNPQFQKIAQQLNLYLADPLHMPAWDFLVEAQRTRSDDDHMMCEPSAYQRPDGALVEMSRDCGPHGSHMMYASVSEDKGKTWTTPTRTNVPDSPSKSVTGTLPNGTTYLIGNQVAAIPHHFRDPLVISLSRDGKSFDWAEAILHGTPPLRYPGRAKSLGFQYPSAIVVGKSLWVIYSINKEDIAISRISLEELEMAK